MREILLPAGIEVQSREYQTEDDPRGIPDLFVSRISCMKFSCYVLYNIMCM